MSRVRRICTECSCEELEEVKKHTDEEGNVVMVEYCCKYCGMNVSEHDAKHNAKKLDTDDEKKEDKEKEVEVDNCDSDDDMV
jgi:hypothetical protein